MTSRLPPLAPIPLPSIGRRILGVTAGILCIALIGGLFWAGGIPWTLDFGRPGDGTDFFLPSIRTLLWWTGLFDLVIIVLLWITLRCWIGQPGSDLIQDDKGSGSFRGLAPVFVSAILAGALLIFINAPRLSESLWNDELWSLGESVHGKWDRDLDGVDPEEALAVIYWQAVNWEHAVWRYDTTNHHFLLNILAKAGLDVWQWLSGSEEWEFDETAMRILPFSCALGGLAAWAFFFRYLGFPSAAMIVPWLLALHPWYQRHATGMRGYPLVFLFFPLTLLAAIHALRGGRWRAWLCFAVFQFLFMYSWPAGAAVMLPFNLCLGITIWMRRANPGSRGDQLKRWAIANLTTFLVLLPLVLPAVFQIGAYLQEEVFRYDMGLPWFRNLACFFFVGSGWPEVAGYSERSGFHVTAETLWRANPILFMVTALSALGAFISGLIILFRRLPGEARLLTLGLLIGPIVGYIKAVSQPDGPDVYIFEWYLIFALPFVCGVAAIGLASAATRVAGIANQSRTFCSSASSIVVMILIAGYAFFAAPRTIAMRQSSVDPRRESVHAIRGDLELTDPANSKILSAHVFRPAIPYDPRGWIVRRASNDDQPAGSPPGLTQLMRIADTRGLTLYVNVGFPAEAGIKYPEIMELIEASELFEVSSRHFGLEPQFERCVYRYKGGLFKFDFSRPKS